MNSVTMDVGQGFIVLSAASIQPEAGRLLPWGRRCLVPHPADRIAGTPIVELARTLVFIPSVTNHEQSVADRTQERFRSIGSRSIPCLASPGPTARQKSICLVYANSPLTGERGSQSWAVLS